MSPLRDAVRLLSPAEVEPRGLFGERLRLCRERQLLTKDEDALLGGFLRRPGSHPWIGEHVGKWLDAACREHERTRDPRLSEKIARVILALRGAQERDGYLGTYLPEARWTEWDVWVHKYVLMGLLAHARAFGDATSLASARRIGELLVETFGERDGGPRVDLASARVSTHAGMAAASVLVAIVPLFRATGDERFLAFARSIARRIEREDGPRIVTGLREGRGVHEIANGKAYEMLSCLAGLVDLARETGDASLVEAATRAFDDVVQHHLHVTGALSFEEYFRAPGTSPCVGDVGETCAVVTWMQLCAELFRLTGERRFLIPFERAAWNHLLAAQRADGAAFCYFTPLAGPRRHRTDVNCCGSSGPRGLSLVPEVVFAVRDGARVEVNLWIDARARVVLAKGSVELDLSTDLGGDAPESFPKRATLVAKSDAPCELAIAAPAWAKRGEAFTLPLQPGVERRIELEVSEPALRTVAGRGRESGQLARLAGPIVLARPETRRAAAADGGSVTARGFVPFFTTSRDDAPLAVWSDAEGREK